MNEHPAHRFLIRTEVVFTTLQDMDEFDAEHFFKQGLAEWEGSSTDLDFESVYRVEVKELPNFDHAYEGYLNHQEELAKVKAAEEAFEALSAAQKTEVLRKRLNLNDAPATGGG